MHLTVQEIEVSIPTRKCRISDDFMALAMTYLLHVVSGQQDWSSDANLTLFVAAK